MWLNKLRIAICNCPNCDCPNCLNPICGDRIANVPEPKLRFVTARFAVPPAKAREASLWIEHGPRAARYDAASFYAQDCAYLPSVWTWASQPFSVRAPTVFDGPYVSAHERGPAVSPPSTKEGTVKNPKLKVQPSAGVTDPETDLSPRRHRPAPSRCSHSPSPAPNYMENLPRTRQVAAAASPRGRQSKSQIRVG